VLNQPITKEPFVVALAGPANHQARIAADSIFASKSKAKIAYRGAQGTSICKNFEMTIASGFNEGKNTDLLPFSQVLDLCLRLKKGGAFLFSWKVGIFIKQPKTHPEILCATRQISQFSDIFVNY
jgi:hypothetical protein